MSKAFASQADLQDKKVSFTKLSDNAYAYTAEGDPNTGVIVGDNAVMVLDTQATPVMAEDVIRHIRTVTDLPIRYVLLTHYHAVRVLGASAYRPQEIIASQETYDLALRCLRPGGTLAVVGLPPEPLKFQALALVGGEYRIVSASVGTRDDLRATLDLAVAGRLRCRVDEAPLAEVNGVFERMRKGAISGRMVLRCC